VALHGGTDDWRFDRTTRTFVPGSDGLFEMEVTLTDNACLLQVGVTDFPGAAAQVTAGVTGAQLAGLPGGALVLGVGNQVQVPAFPGCGPAADSADLAALEQALTQLQQAGSLRVWPLYLGVADGATLDGFVAARVVRVLPRGAGEPLRFILQPGVLAVSSAVTDATRRDAGVAFPNPYLAKLRLVE
jgi:hypothetical protein